jgi:hypothetical protein
LTKEPTVSRPANLFYLAAPRFGGWPVFTAHLAETLRTVGFAPHLLKVGARTESISRDFGYGLNYQNVSLDAACSLAGSGPALVTACDPAHAAALGPILRAGAALVIHDPTEMRPPLLEAARAARVVVCIRRANLAALGSAGLRARFIPHPYVPAFPEGYPAGPRPRWAISISRVDFDKHTDLIAAANEVLPPDRRILIRGDVNRLYAHHKLDPGFPRWRDMLAGRFDPDFHAGAELAAGFRYVVDMSDISGDGRGGTQYTFLEAWDAGSVLVVNRRWLDGAPEDSPLREGVSCLAASDAAELARIMMEPPDRNRIADGGRLTLAAHLPTVLAPAWAEVM